MTKLWTVLKQDWKRQAIAAFVVVGALGIFVWWLQTESYQGPAKTEERVGDLGRSSTMVIPITASLDEIQTKLNEQIPSALYTIDENRDDCVPAQWVEYCLIPRPWPFSGCIQTAKTQVTPSIDCHVDGAATRGAIH